MNPDPKKYEILLVEDSPSDVLIIREALSEVVFNNNLVVVERWGGCRRLFILSRLV